jgi:hypothetical protein
VSKWQDAGPEEFLIAPGKTFVAIGGKEGTMRASAWIIAALSAVIWTDVAVPAPTDFAVCDGQAGVALGLCRGGIAAGCAGAGGGTEACLAIESNYRQMSGGDEAPWIKTVYPVNTIAVVVGVGLDLESGVAAYDPGVVKYENPSFPDCFTTGTCAATDLTADYWEERAGDSGNPMYFYQTACTVPDEPGYGGVPEYVVLRNVAFAGVSNATIDAATFVQASFERWWSPVPNLGCNDTLIVHTCAGNYFKVGNQKCNYPGAEWPMCKDEDLPEYWTRFDYQMLRQAP